MRRENVNDYLAFIAVAREQSFTKAAAQLSVSQSALSYTVRTLEARLGLRLLTRTTRSVSVTEAGERLLNRIGPHFDEIESEIAALLRHSGSVDIVTDIRATKWMKLVSNATHPLDGARLAEARLRDAGGECRETGWRQHAGMVAPKDCHLLNTQTISM
jgi:hypothetical protein